MAIFAGCAITFGLGSKSKPLQVTVALLVVAAAASALPVMRPWEYFNELIGGAKNGYLYFNDEGVDLWQRSNELAGYYHLVLQPAGEIPVAVYPIFPIEMKARGLNWPERKGDLLQYLKGSPTVLVDAKGLSRTSYWDHEFLARRTPTARFGNLLIFRGPCEGCEALMSQGLFYGSIGKMYAQKPDLVAAEQMLKMSIALNATGAAPQFATMTPWLLTRPSQFRVQPPNALTSPEYAADYNEIKTMGAFSGSLRTDDQSELVLFWAGNTPLDWNRVAVDLSVSRGFSLGQNAHLFALLNLAMADAGIACWDSKYRYVFWRPVTAIHLGDTDGNPSTDPDPDWAPG